MLIIGIRVTQVRNADLNLIVYFIVLAEERSLTRVAKRLFLTQPSMTRALQRLRELFADDLLIRSANGYVLTPKGETLLQEISQFLPRLDRLISGSEFDPTRETAHFRVAATDNAASLYGPILAQLFAGWANVPFSSHPWTDNSHDDLERGRIHLLLNAEEGSLPPHLKHEILFKDRFVCVVARDRSLKARITLKQYLAAHHIGVSVLGGRQIIPERILTQLGVKRQCVISVLYFTVALKMVAGTPLVATVPERLARSSLNGDTVKLLNPPSEFQVFRYLMAWHPRHDTDVQNHWLRALLKRATASIPGNGVN